MKEYTFLACRPDGLGARLRAILNAMIAADRLGGRFMFHWVERNDHNSVGHALPSPECLFSKNFLKDFHIAGEELKYKNVVEFRSAAEQIERGEFDVDSDTFIKVSHANLSEQAGSISELQSNKYPYKEFFEKLEFSYDVTEAIYAAKSLKISQEAIAIHVRAGDIIFGKYRYMDRYNQRAAPLPIALEIVENAIESGRLAVIFSQDRDLNKIFRSRFPRDSIILTDEIVDEYKFSSLQQAMFDILLMARCEVIFAGTSGFAKISGQIGDVPVKNARQWYGSEDALKIIERFVFSKDIEVSVPPLHVAFACRSAFHICGHPSIPASQRFQKLLDRARALDPENDYYHFIQACVYYEKGDPEKAEILLEERVRLHDGKRIGILYALRHGAIDKHDPEAALHRVSIIQRAAEENWPMAALCMSIMRKAEGKDAAASIYERVFLEIASKEIISMGKRVLRKMK